MKAIDLSPVGWGIILHKLAKFCSSFQGTLRPQKPWESALRTFPYLMVMFQTLDSVKHEEVILSEPSKVLLKVKEGEGIKFRYYV